MSKRPWLSKYPPEVPQEFDLERYQNLGQFFDETSAQFSSHVAFENMGKGISYQKLGQLSDSFGAYLQQELGLKKGDKFAIQLPNIMQYPVVMQGALKAGLTVVNVNPLYTAPEMEHQLNDSGAKAIVILVNFASKLEEILPKTKVKHVILTQLGDMLGTIKGGVVNFVVKRIKKMVPAYQIPDAISFQKTITADGSRLQRPHIKPQDLAFLQYTGGTTGVSKGAMLTHGNLCCNLQQLEAWLMPAQLKHGQEIYIAALPLYHIFALNAHALYPLKIGAKNVLITNPRDLPAFVKELSKHKFTFISGVNTLFNALLNTPGFDKLDHSTIKIALSGGMALQRSVFDRWKKVTGSEIIEAYGLTETSPALCINPASGDNRVGTIGMPIPKTEVVLLDDDGHEVAAGEKGELCAKGPQVFAGYWGREEETEKCFINGYFRTGDIATMDEDGYFRIVDRKKEMILVSGFNVYPNEVEDAIAMHDQVLEVAAIGVPDEKSGEVVKVYIVKKDNSLTAEDILAHCKDKLTAYKRPKYVAFTDELPKSNVGKILRRLVKEQDAKDHQYA